MSLHTFTALEMQRFFFVEIYMERRNIYVFQAEMIPVEKKSRRYFFCWKENYHKKVRNHCICIAYLCVYNKSACLIDGLQQMYRLVGRVLNFQDIACLKKALRNLSSPNIFFINVQIVCKFSNVIKWWSIIVCGDYNAPLSPSAGKKLSDIGVNQLLLATFLLARDFLCWNKTTRQFWVRFCIDIWR